MPDLTFPTAVGHVVAFGILAVVVFFAPGWEEIVFGLMAIISAGFAIFSLVKQHPNDALAIGGFAALMACAFVKIHFHI